MNTRSRVDQRKARWLAWLKVVRWIGASRPVISALLVASGHSVCKFKTRQQQQMNDAAWWKYLFKVKLLSSSQRRDSPAKKLLFGKPHKQSLYSLCAQCIFIRRGVGGLYFALSVWRMLCNVSLLRLMLSVDVFLHEPRVDLIRPRWAAQVNNMLSLLLINAGNQTDFNALGLYKTNSLRGKWYPGCYWNRNPIIAVWLIGFGIKIVYGTHLWKVRLTCCTI